MNVDDIAEVEVPTVGSDNDMLDLIFQRQHELLMKYHPIEAYNGLLHTDQIPVDLHDRHGQAQLKDLAWRFTEEITESTIARMEHSSMPQHAEEEVADAYHFLVELLILAGHTSESTGKHLYIRAIDCKLSGLYAGAGLATSTVGISVRAYNAIESVGRAMNRLKNKPWKSAHMLTDIPAFHRDLVDAHMNFLVFAISMGLDTAEKLFKMYFRKSEVNKFRQRSNY